MKEIQELTEKDIKRYWSKVQRLGEDDCWPWIGGMHNEYGEFEIHRNGKPIRYKSHRVGCFIKTNIQGILVRHHCDNPSCHNPKHIDWGTPLENVQDMISRGRASFQRNIQDRICGERHGMAKLLPIDIINIRNEFDCGSLTKNQLAEQYRVSVPNIRAIVTRKTWKHI